MRWEHLFDDLEGELSAAAAAELAGEVADRTRGERATIPLSARLRAGLGQTLRVAVGEDVLSGVVSRVGADWFLMELDPPGGTALVVTAAVSSYDGLPPAAIPDDLADPTARLGLRAALRVIARDRAHVHVVAQGGRRWAGTVGSVGADAVDLVLADADGRPRADAQVTVPLAQLAMLRTS